MPFSINGVGLIFDFAGPWIPTSVYARENTAPNWLMSKGSLCVTFFQPIATKNKSSIISSNFFLIHLQKVHAYWMRKYQKLYPSRKIVTTDARLSLSRLRWKRPLLIKSFIWDSSCSLYSVASSQSFLSLSASLCWSMSSFFRLLCSQSQTHSFALTDLQRCHKFVEEQQQDGRYVEQSSFAYGNSLLSTKKGPVWQICLELWDETYSQMKYIINYKL